MSDAIVLWLIFGSLITISGWLMSIHQQLKRHNDRDEASDPARRSREEPR